MNEGGDFDKLGRGHVWDGSIDPCIHQNHVFAVRPFGVSPQWLNLVTGSAYAQFYFMSRSKQSTNLASISHIGPYRSWGSAMITETSAVAFRQNLGEMLNLVQYRNDSILIKKDGKPVAALIDAKLFLRIRQMQERFDALVRPSWRGGLCLQVCPRPKAWPPSRQATARARRRDRGGLACRRAAARVACRS